MSHASSLLLHGAQADALRLAFPSRDRVPLLRACLLQGKDVHRAWKAWCDQAAPPRSALQAGGEGVKRLLPLLGGNLRRQGAFVDSELGSLLRAARLWEEKRAAMLMEICGDLLEALKGKGVQAVVLGGLAVAKSLYRNAAMRHCGAINLLVPSAYVGKALECAIPVGFAPMGRSVEFIGARRSALHESGLMLKLHDEPFLVPTSDKALAGVWERAKRVDIGGICAHVMDWTDALLHTCASLFFGKASRTLDWACDSWLISSRCDNRDWKLLENTARNQALSPLLSVMLEFLSQELHAPVPEGTRAALAKGGAGLDAHERSALTHAACHMARVHLGEALGSIDRWPLPVFAVRAALFPPLFYMRQTYGISRKSLLPLFYVGIPARHLMMLLCRR